MTKKELKASAAQAADAKIAELRRMHVRLSKSDMRAIRAGERQRAEAEARGESYGRVVGITGPGRVTAITSTRVGKIV